jgi:hypothetical protein
MLANTCATTKLASAPLLSMLAYLASSAIYAQRSSLIVLTNTGASAFNALLLLTIAMWALIRHFYSAY